MKNQWILDVLGDLSSFASKNGYPVLAEHLQDTFMVATAELSQGDPSDDFASSLNERACRLEFTKPVIDFTLPPSSNLPHDPPPMN